MLNLTLFAVRTLLNLTLGDLGSMLTSTSSAEGLRPRVAARNTHFGKTLIFHSLL